MGIPGSAITKPDVEVDGLLVLSRGALLKLANFLFMLLEGFDEVRKVVIAFLHCIKEVASLLLPFRAIVLERLEKTKRLLI